jgi:hypothetical protein
MEVPHTLLTKSQQSLHTARTAGLEMEADRGKGRAVVLRGAASWSRRVKPLMGLIAITCAILIAVLAGNADSHHIVYPDSVESLSEDNANALADQITTTPAASPRSPKLNRMRPQEQAETLLSLAIAHSNDALRQISTRVDRWEGKLTWDSTMATLTNTALHSNDLRVRQSGIAVELAAYGLGRNSDSLEYLLHSAASADHGKKIWSLWALGLIGNRGVESSRVAQVLAAQLKDPDSDSRHWAVEGLALLGSPDAIPVLLATMHDDSSAVVREAAACSLAQSGTFTRAQRMSAIPKLLAYTDDSSLDRQTRGWAFQALADITRQQLPNDSAVWRRWYGKVSDQRLVASGQ